MIRSVGQVSGCLRGTGALAALITALACSGMNLGMKTATGGGQANVDTCLAYVQRFNDAACTSLDLDPADVCPESLKITECDFTAYYGCMAEAVSCNGEFLDVSGQSNCGAPICK